MAMSIRILGGIMVVGAVLAVGCAPSARRPGVPSARVAQVPAGAAAGTARSSTVEPATARNLDRLRALQRQRQDEVASGDYRLGPGDVLSVRAYELDELNQRVRVDGDGNIVLPLLNTVPVEGRTMAEIERDLTTRLGAYMYHPKVTVFIEEYRSQQVAVVGAVQRPGLVAQTKRDATVLDAIAAAGGKTVDAANRIYLIPAETRGATTGATVADLTAASAPCGETPCDSPSGSVNGDPIVLDVNEMPQEAQARFLSLPVKGGDVVIVPGNGHFVVEGWVEKPGSYALQAGLTLRGAIAMAGGLSFPAESTHVRIFRQSPNGAPETIAANLDEISARRASDVYLREGDVVEIASSKVKLVSYGAYRLVTDLVRVGARLTPF